MAHYAFTSDNVVCLVGRFGYSCQPVGFWQELYTRFDAILPELAQCRVSGSCSAFVYIIGLQQVQWTLQEAAMLAAQGALRLLRECQLVAQQQNVQLMLKLSMTDGPATAAVLNTTYLHLQFFGPAVSTASVLAEEAGTNELRMLASTARLVPSLPLISVPGGCKALGQPAFAVRVGKDNVDHPIGVQQHAWLQYKDPRAEKAFLRHMSSGLQVPDLHVHALIAVLSLAALIVPLQQGILRYLPWAMLLQPVVSVLLLYFAATASEAYYRYRDAASVGALAVLLVVSVVVDMCLGPTCHCQSVLCSLALSLLVYLYGSALQVRFRYQACFATLWLCCTVVATVVQPCCQPEFPVLKEQRWTAVSLACILAMLPCVLSYRVEALQRCRFNHLLQV